MVHGLNERIAGESSTLKDDMKNLGMLVDILLDPHAA